MLLLIIALFLIYNMTSVCGDGFNVGASNQGNFVLNQTCKTTDYTQCINKYFERDTNTYGEPQYYPCQLDKKKVCHQKYSDDKPNLIKCTNQCPSCGDLSKYTLLGSECTKNLETCKQCLNPTNDVTFTGIQKKGRPMQTLTDKYSKICPKSGSYVGTEYTECDDTKSRCINDLQSILKVEMNSTGKCSINDIYTKIKNASGELSLNCNGNNNINGEEAWLDETLSLVGDGYCKPVNASWTCTRDIPEYCKNGQCVLTGDTNNKKCGCPEGTSLLNNGKCGKVTCKGFNDGVCLKGESCMSDNSPNPVGLPTYFCSNNHIPSCKGTEVDTCDAATLKQKDCTTKYYSSDWFQGPKYDSYHQCAKGTDFGCQSSNLSCTKPK